MNKATKNRAEKKQKFMKRAFNEMFMQAGHDFDYDKAIEHENRLDIGIFPDNEENDWYNYFTYTSLQASEFKTWFINNYCKSFRQNKRKGPESGEAIYEWFNSNYGLRVVDPIKSDEI